MSNLKLDSTAMSMRALFEEMVARLAALSDASAQLKSMRILARFTRLMMDYERDLIAKARRAEVLASPALRRAAYLAIGLSAILRWEDAWHRRKDPVKPRQTYNARPQTRSKTSPQSCGTTDILYALMPLPKRDYKRRKSETVSSWVCRGSSVSRFNALPPAYVYPHEICARPPVWAKEEPRQRYLPPDDTSAFRDQSQTMSKCDTRDIDLNDGVHASIRDGPEL
ncbi:hypothetical protein [Fretibacter rubidus]|uniref:hypothetical protein n=1 Tax=Fretibacter rubidus TaxID=570162 RepID=UPI00352BA856